MLIPATDLVKVVANQEFEALFPKFQPSRVTITTNDGKEQCKKLQSFIMSMETAKSLGGLFELTTARFN